MSRCAHDMRALYVRKPRPERGYERAGEVCEKCGRVAVRDGLGALL